MGIDSATPTFEAGVSGDTSYGLPSNHNTADCALNLSAKEVSYTSPAPFSDPSITWTNTEIIESLDTNGDTVFTPTLGDDLFLQYTVSGDPQGMAASEYPLPEYGTATGQSPELKFCVRLGLYGNALTDPSTDEINFFESVVTISIDFNGNFEVLGIGVAPKEQGQSTAAVVYTASAELCGATAEAGNGGKTALEYGQAVKVNNNFNQGAAIMVCISLDVAAKDDGVAIDKINSFNWNQEGSIPKTQVGIDGAVAIQQTAGGNGGTYSISNVVGVAITSIAGL